ncbi:MAG TPA: glycosyltransferase [Bacillota bacterium]|nr:glycosyltransferase [Bacillota bacterium]
MRILFLDSNEVFTHLLPNGFREAGHTVMVSGVLTEEKIPSLIEQFKPDIIFSQGWGPEQTVEKQIWMRQYIKKTWIPHIYWSVEDPRYTETFVLPLIYRVKPDFVFTICPSAVDYFKSLGIRAARLEFGYEPTINGRVAKDEQYQSDIALVANAYSWDMDNQDHDYKTRLQYLDVLIRPLVKNNRRIDIWGRGWEFIAPYLGYAIPRDWLRGYVTYKDVNKVYSSAKIVIGVQSYETQVTQRIYEILGSGAFLLTNDTPEVRRIFTPGKDLVVSSSYEDTLKLVDQYLNDEGSRKKICSQGEQTVSQYSYKHRAEHVLDVLRQEGFIR